jgi:hypothetical protein
MLTALAASGHLAYDAICFAYISPCRSALAGQAQKKNSPGPGATLGGPASYLRQGQGCFSSRSIYAGFPTHYTSLSSGCRGKTAVALSRL